MVSYSIFKTEFGFCGLIWQKSQVLRFMLPEKNKNELLKRVKQNFEGAVKTVPNEEMRLAILQIQHYFSGRTHDFSKIKLSFSDVPTFHKKIYKQLIKIKTRDIISYKDLAKLSGNAKGARAVGQAVQRNPLPLLIPCHRVIKSDGTLGGFTATEGIPLKIKMLELEGIKINNSTKPKLSSPLLISDIDTKNAIKTIIKNDYRFGKHIKALGEFEFQINTLQSPFLALLEAIIYQQLTGKAAATIFTRFLNLFGHNGCIRPFDVIRAGHDELRSAGLSNNKVLAIKDLAEKTISGEIPTLKKLVKMQNCEIIRNLTLIRGIGRWTVEMFLIFRLGRADILAKDDYGLQKGLAKAYNLKEHPKGPQLELTGEIWKPYRTIASLYLWRLADTKTV